MGKAGPESAGAVSMADPCGTLNQAVAPSSGAIPGGGGAVLAGAAPPRPAPRRDRMIRGRMMLAIAAETGAGTARGTYGLGQRGVQFYAKCPGVTDGAKGLAMPPGLHPRGGGGMKKPVRSWMYVAAAAAVAVAPVVATSGTTQAATQATHAVTHAAVQHASLGTHMHIDCSTSAAMCAEVANSDEVFGHYVGHDEPAMAFYSHKAGSGNHMSYNITLPV